MCSILLTILTQKQDTSNMSMTGCYKHSLKKEISFEREGREG